MHETVATKWLELRRNHSTLYLLEDPTKFHEIGQYARAMHHALWARGKETLTMEKALNPTLMNVEKTVVTSVRTPTQSCESHFLTRKLPPGVFFLTNHNLYTLRDIITYHLAPFDLILFSSLPSSLSFPVVNEIFMTSHGPSRAWRCLIPEVAIEPPSLATLICCISPWNVSNFLSRK